MKPAFAHIPDAYMELALDSDVWYWFVAAVAVIIRAMQAFERAALAVVERCILWPFVQIRRTVYHSASLAASARWAGKPPVKCKGCGTPCPSIRAARAHCR